MFTGIVEEAGKVVRIRAGKKSTELQLQAKKIARTLRTGQSLAVNGACLTLASRRGKVLSFDVLNETLARTNFGEFHLGALVNLERPLRADGRMDGHFVQGHVDGTGVVRRWEKDGADYVLEVTTPSPLLHYFVEKGSIAVDGISLTIAGLGRNWFRVWIIPHTCLVTNLRNRRIGEKVNLEVDILAKYVERTLRGRPIRR